MINKVRGRCNPSYGYDERCSQIPPSLLNSSSLLVCVMRPIGLGSSRRFWGRQPVIIHHQRVRVSFQVIPQGILFCINALRSSIQCLYCLYLSSVSSVSAASLAFTASASSVSAASLAFTASRTKRFSSSICHLANRLPLF